MHSGGDKRRKEHRQHLGIHRAAYFPVVHSHLAEYVEPRPVVVSLAYLLIVHYKHRRENKYSTENYTQEKQSAVHAIVFLQFKDAALQLKAVVFLAHHIYEIVENRRFLGIGAIQVEAVVILLLR